MMGNKGNCMICGRMVEHRHRVDDTSLLCCRCTDGVLKTRTKSLEKIRTIKGDIEEALEEIGW